MEIRYSLADIDSLKDRIVFLDANILLHIFWDRSGSHWQHLYSAFYKELLHHNISMVTNFTVISEVVNRAVKREYEVWLHKTYLDHHGEMPCFKMYRNSPEGQSALNAIYHQVKMNLLQSISIKGHIYDRDEIIQLMVYDQLDFNDKAIVSICRHFKYVLFTNDADFKACDVEIISANPQILTHS